MSRRQKKEAKVDEVRRRTSLLSSARQWPPCLEEQEKEKKEAAELPMEKSEARSGQHQARNVGTAEFTSPLRPVPAK